MRTLAARLGYAPDAKLLIVNCDDLGLTQAGNVAVYDAFQGGAATSASLMVPCPWARQAAARMGAHDVGVHLTLNAEFRSYRWGPITVGSSLVDGEGHLARTAAEVWHHANLDETRTEVRTQIQRALEWGVDVTHLDAHLGTLVLQPQFFEIYLDAAVYYGLPVRLTGPSTERFVGFPFRQLAASRGVVFPDHLLYVPGIGSRAGIERVLADLRPGVTEVYVHPAIDTPETRAFDPDWAARADDYDLVAGPRLVELANRAGAALVGYRKLRDLQRSN